MKSWLDSFNGFHYLATAFLVQACLIGSDAVTTAVTPSGGLHFSEPKPIAPVRNETRDARRLLPRALIRKASVLEKYGSLGMAAALALDGRWLPSMSVSPAKILDGMRIFSEITMMDMMTRLEEEKAREGKKATVLEFKDDQCSESQLSGGFRLPDSTALEDGACIRAFDTIQENREVANLMGLKVNVMLTCWKNGDAVMSGVFGEDCLGGEDDKMTFKLLKEEAIKFGEGECAQGKNQANKANVWVKLENRDQLSKKAWCLESKSYKMLWIFIFSLAGVLLVLIVSIGVVFAFKKSKAKKNAPGKTEATDDKKETSAKDEKVEAAKKDENEDAP